MEPQEVRHEPATIHIDTVGLCIRIQYICDRHLSCRRGGISQLAVAVAIKQQTVTLDWRSAQTDLPDTNITDSAVSFLLAQRQVLVVTFRNELTVASASEVTRLAAARLPDEPGYYQLWAELPPSPGLPDNGEASR